MKKIILVLSFSFMCLFANNLKVTVSILPQKYFVEQIAEEKVKVNVMVRAGFSPATYEPKTSQMKLLSDSQVYFSIGVPFENSWLEKFENANKKMLLVNTSKGIVKLEMSEHDHHEDKNEKEHHQEENKHQENHSEDGLDPHVWLDPLLVKIQAKSIYETLIKVDYKNKVFYTKNYHNFLKKLDELNIQIESKLKNVSKSEFMVFHPSWGYFAKRYDLEQIIVEKEGKEPKPKEIVELIKEAKEHQIKVIFVSPQFSQKAAKTIAQSIKGKVVNIDHLAYNYPEGLVNAAQAIYDSYK